MRQGSPDPAPPPVLLNDGERRCLEVGSGAGLGGERVAGQSHVILGTVKRAVSPPGKEVLLVV